MEFIARNLHSLDDFREFSKIFQYFNSLPGQRVVIKKTKSEERIRYQFFEKASFEALMIDNKICMAGLIVDGYTEGLWKYQIPNMPCYYPKITYKIFRQGREIESG